ncbi:MAG: GGDEF domain-containing protein [Faecousia sp.]
METINIPEILLVNGIGVMLMLLLRATWLGSVKKRRAGDILYDMIILITILGCVLEAVSFLIDGKIFQGCRVVSYAVNALLFLGTIFVGCFWCLYVDFRIHTNVRRLYISSCFLLIPVAVVTGLVISSVLGSGLMFTISPENVYQRGKLVWISYVFLFGYYAYSLYLSLAARKSGLHIQFFPVLYFIIPCILGTVLQGLFYGISIGWTTVAIAMTFVHVQLQSMNAYVDSLSELYNRRYLDYILSHRKHLGGRFVYGIYIDMNDFKGINDRYGHSCGDDAIRTIGRILSESTPTGGVAIRCAGDEFLILMVTPAEAAARAVMAKVEQKTKAFNDSGEAPYTISMAIGISRFDTERDSVEEFLANLDKQMYAAKDTYYRTQGFDRRKK